MKVACRLAISILPIPLFFLAMLVLKGPARPLLSIVLSCLAFLAWWLLSSWQGIARPRVGSPLGLLLGVALGAMLTIGSVAAMGVVGAYPFDFQPFPADALVGSMKHHIRPACVEETFVRAGTVHFLASFFGAGWGYLGGSIPFGVMHLVNPSTTYKHVICISSFGWLASVLYLELGLFAAIGVHFTWNVLSVYLINSLNWAHLGGSAFALEGAWTTTFLILTVTLAILAVSYRRKGPGRIDHEPGPLSATG